MNTGISLPSWVFLGALAIIALTLGVLQYQWLGDVSRAERDRLQSSVEAGLTRLTHDFNAQLTSVCTALMPPADVENPSQRDREYSVRYRRWHEMSGQAGLIRTAAVARPQDGKVSLRLLDPSGLQKPVPWPESWRGMEQRWDAEPRHGPPPENTAANQPELLIEIPHITGGAFLRMPGAGLTRHSSRPNG